MSYQGCCSTLQLFCMLEKEVLKGTVCIIRGADKLESLRAEMEHFGPF